METCCPHSTVSAQQQTSGVFGPDLQASPCPTQMPSGATGSGRHRGDHGTKPCEPDPRHGVSAFRGALLQNSYALERYVPSAVSTLIFSPSLMKGGTCTIRPVSVFAGFVTLEAVALFRPGSTSVTVRITVWGNSMPTALPSKNSTLIWRLGVRYSTASPRVSRVR